MNKLKPCPFCGGWLRVMERTEDNTVLHTRSECMGCNMIFEYNQYFSISKQTRVPDDDPFETAWNRRAEDGRD